MTLPYDVARCMTPCSLAQICRRTEPGRGQLQPFSEFPGGPECWGLIERERAHDQA